MTLKWDAEAEARALRMLNDPPGALWRLWVRYRRRIVAIVAAAAVVFTVGVWYGRATHPSTRCVEDEVWDQLVAHCVHVEGSIIDGTNFCGRPVGVWCVPSREGR